MTKDNAAMANKEVLPKATHLETAVANCSFYSEASANMKTPEGRLAWFCAHFELIAPTLEYDPDEPDAILLTDDIIEFCNNEGMSLDWFFWGHVAGPLAIYREKHRVSDEARNFLDIVRKLGEQEQEILAAGLQRVTSDGADLDAVLQEVRAEIDARRV